MDQLFGVINGWLSYLTRWPVLCQVIVVLGPLLAVDVLSRFWVPAAGFRRYRHLLSAAVMLALIVILALVGARFGLALYLFLVYVLWLFIDLQQQWLQPRVDVNLLAKIDTGILRPLLLIVAVFGLISKVSNINQLAAIPLVSWFGTTLTLGQLVTVLVALYALIVGSLPLSFLLAALFGRLLNLTPGSRRALTLMLRYSIVGAGLLWALDFTGFNRTAILAIAGGLSVGLGFGIKEVFANFISGIWLLLEGSVRPGEILFIDNDACEVRRIGLRAALLWRDRDNTELLIPNQIFLTTITTTFTCTDGLRRCEVVVSVAYRHQPPEVMQLIVQATGSVEAVLTQPAPVSLVLDYGDSAIQYAVRFWIADPIKGTVISSDVRLAIWQRFKEHAIEIPFPQLVLHKS